MLKNLKIPTLILFMFISFVSFGQNQNQTYESAIEAADKSFGLNDYISAKTYYEMALRLKKDDSYATKKLSETIGLIKKQMGVQAYYFEKIDLADKQWKNGQIELAIRTYQEALKIVPNDAYAVAQIDKLNKQFRDDKEKNERFSSLIVSGHNLVEQQKFEEALFQFNEAFRLFPENQLVADNIEKTKLLLSDQKLKESNFAAFLQEAKNLLNRKDYAKAIESYQKALMIFPDDAITQNELKEAVRLSELSKDYEESLAKADALYAEKDFRKSVVFYEKAVNIFPDQPYPADMLKRINEMLTGKDFVDEKAYAETIALADKNLMQGLRAEAKDEYSFALKLKPGDQYASSKIKEIDALIEALQNTESIDKQYHTLIIQGEESYQQSDFKTALQYFQSALTLKPTEILPLERINQLEALINKQNLAEANEKKYLEFMADAEKFILENNLKAALSALQAADSIFPERNQLDKKINELTMMLAEQEKIKTVEIQFNALLAETQKLIETGKWENASISSNKAIAMKPDNLVALDQQKLIQDMLQTLALTEKIRNEFDKKIKEADQLYADQRLSESKNAYEQALLILKDETYPISQIALINNLLSERELEKNKLEKLAELHKTALVLYTDQQYLVADSVYIVILNMDATDNAAKQKRAEILSIKLESERQNNLRYQEFVTKADRYYEARDYKEAVIAYKTALSYFPQDTIASQRIVSAELILREQLLKLKTEYDKFIVEADKQFYSKAYDKAIENYSKAAETKPDEVYPIEMMAKISRIIEENKLFELNIEPLKLISNTNKRFEFEPVVTNERRTNYILIKARNTGQSNFSLIVSYGSKTGRNGGFVLPIPASTEYKDYIVRIGSQYKWFSEDNTWIDFYPENGEVEVGLIQISKGN